ncbi:hypothetical protein PtB15_14B213 [Puccinia triticina]|nr:hypothetical protein PtB15_14B213 [Puccinia triticina]
MFEKGAAKVEEAVVFGGSADVRKQADDADGWFYQSLHRNQATGPEVVGMPGQPATDAADIRHFVYSDYIKEDIRDFIRRKLLEGRLVAYSRQTNDAGEALPNALMNMTQAHIARLPLRIREQHLPPRYSQGNTHAQRSVLSLVREQLKHNRVSLRNLLLRNIIDTSFSRVTGAAPSLEVLYNMINSAFFSAAGVIVAPVNWLTLPIAVKIRFAYLRLQTAEHSRNPTHGHGSQWTPIDNQLLFLATQSMEYVRSWADLILKKDTEMFGAGGAIYASVKHIQHLPTHEEVVENQLNTD